MIETTLIVAIRELRQVELQYGGHWRVVEPHALGDSDSGETLLRCYQVRGGAESGEQSGWKLLKTADIGHVTVKADRFTQRPSYRRNDSAMTIVRCQL